MKARSVAAILICLAALGVILLVASAPVSYAGAGEPATLGIQLGPVSLLPPLVAVALAFLTKDVMSSLAAGLASGVGLIAAVEGKPLFAGISYTFTQSCRTVVDTASAPDNCTVLVLCLVIGGMVEVIRVSGGFHALAQRMTKRIRTVRRANLVGELLGVLVFFDDYANSLIVGPVMQPVTDKLKISREKLAYLVDSTAAPVTGIAVVSSWVAVEVAVINEGFALAGVARSGYATFLSSIPYCFYCIFLLVFILESSLLRREFGPMLSAEQRARQEASPAEPADASAAPGAASGKKRQRITVALLPILLLCVLSFVSFYFHGRSAAISEGLLDAAAPFSLETAAVAFGSADTIFLVMEASILASIVAIALGCAFRLFPFREGLAAWVAGASNLLITVLILVLAWSLAAVVEQLGSVYYVVEAITLGVPWQLVPTLIFICCCIVSFAVGSYGCLFIAMPMAIPIAISVSQAGGVTHPEAFLLTCIASVLSGGIFGDHCSPLTDCTILSSMGAGCDNMAHVRTQMPYALTVAAVSVLCGTLLSALGVPAILCLIAGFAVLAGILLLFGRNPDKPANNSMDKET